MNKLYALGVACYIAIETRKRFPCERRQVIPGAPL